MNKRKGVVGSNQVLTVQQITNLAMTRLIAVTEDQNAWNAKFGSPNVFGAWEEDGVTKYAQGGFKFPWRNLIGSGTTLTAAMGDYIRKMTDVVDDANRRAEAACYDLDRVREALGIQT